MILAALHSIAHGLGRFGAGSVAMALAALVFFSAYAAGYFVWRRTYKRWAAGASGALVLAILALIFGSAINTLHEESCRGVADHDQCMGDDD